MTIKTLDERTEAQIVLEDLKAFLKAEKYSGNIDFEFEIDGTFQFHLKLKQFIFITSVGLKNMREYLKQFQWSYYIDGSKIVFYDMKDKK